MKYDRGNRVFITPSLKYYKQGLLTGICGNFDGRDKDDNVKRNRLPATNDGDLGSGWANEIKCIAKDSNYKDVCKKYIDRRSWAYKGEFIG